LSNSLSSVSLNVMHTPLDFLKRLSENYSPSSRRPELSPEPPPHAHLLDVDVVKVAYPVEPRSGGRMQPMAQGYAARVRRRTDQPKAAYRVQAAPAAAECSPWRKPWVTVPPGGVKPQKKHKSVPHQPVIRAESSTPNPNFGSARPILRPLLLCRYPQ
jgi:hypothetical protein